MIMQLLLDVKLKSQQVTSIHTVTHILNFTHTVKEASTSQVSMEPIQSLVYFSSSLGIARVPVVRRVVLAGQVPHYRIAATRT